jgi:hypothetical protein
VAPYDLDNTGPSQSTASFSIAGIESDGVTSVAYTGIFTDQSTGENYQTILAGIEGGVPFTAQYSAQIQTESLPGTPEPSSLFESMMGIGLVGISVVYRRKLKRA